MLELQSIARTTGVTVIASIHQPSERVFELSDRLLLLAGGKSGGHQVYFGPTCEAEGARVQLYATYRASHF
jgi:ABC-type multidrug transport system ATPase subunit